MTQLPFFQAFNGQKTAHEVSELPTLPPAYLFSHPQSFNSSL